MYNYCVSCFIVFPIHVHHRLIDLIDISRSDLHLFRNIFGNMQNTTSFCKNIEKTPPQKCLSFPPFPFCHKAFSAPSLRQRYLQLRGNGDGPVEVEAPSAATSVTTEHLDGVEVDWKEQALNEENSNETKTKSNRYSRYWISYFYAY